MEMQNFAESLMEKSLADEYLASMVMIVNCW